jgi:diguanylate cyclase (GGDEF)-like protein
MAAGLRTRREIIKVLAFARRTELLAFLPAVTLAAFWVGGEAALLVTALCVPILYALAGILGASPAGEMVLPGTDPVTGLRLRDAAIDRLDSALGADPQKAGGTACIALMLDDADHLARLHGHAGFAEILRQTGARLAGVLRRQDVACRLDGACFAIALGPMPRADLETVLQTAARLQEAAEVAISLDATTVHVSASVGFCLAGRAPEPGGAALLDAAMAAMDDANFNGPGAIRAYTTELSRRRADMDELRRDLGPALDAGEVQAFFQPQLSTDTGAITGFETLVRWVHPDRGVLAPSQFLPGLLAAGLSERLGEVMLTGALRALRTWERDGHRIPSVGVNFSAEELRNPRLPDKIQWELDRFGLTPDRLTIEIREEVLREGTDEVIVQGIARIAGMGCRIDLDEFGTGPASVVNIRRFAVSRIKIGRAFVAAIHEDRAQQRTVAAILSLAERLGLDSLAVGVESPGEHAMLAQLGCGHVQGFAIARPMPVEEAGAWIAAHGARPDPALPVGRRLV